MKNIPNKKSNTTNYIRTFDKPSPMSGNNYQRRKRDTNPIPILSNNDVEIANEFVDDKNKK